MMNSKVGLYQLFASLGFLLHAPLWQEKKFLLKFGRMQYTSVCSPLIGASTLFRMT